MYYEILYAQEDAAHPNPVPNWIAASSNKSVGSNLISILNYYAKQGGKVVATGDFGFGSKTEILIEMP